MAESEIPLNKYTMQNCGKFVVSSEDFHMDVVNHCYGFAVVELNYGTPTQRALHHGIIRRRDEIQQLFNEKYLLNVRPKGELKNMTDSELNSFVIKHYNGKHHQDICENDVSLYRMLERRGLISKMVEGGILRNGNREVYSRPYMRKRNDYCGKRVRGVNGLDAMTAGNGHRVPARGIGLI